jgi:hypothetical protein
MNKLLTTAVLISIATTAPAGARWYVGHWGPEACVPLDDIGENGERMYYGTGSMRTPQDEENWLRRGGMVISPPPSPPGSSSRYAFTATMPGGSPNIIMLFSDKSDCDYTMHDLDNAGLR